MLYSFAIDFTIAGLLTIDHCNLSLQYFFVVGFDDSLPYGLCHAGRSSNPHHPKNCEPVRFSECKEARNSHTNYWTWD